MKSHRKWEGADGYVPIPLEQGAFGGLIVTFECFLLFNLNKGIKLN